MSERTPFVEWLLTKLATDEGPFTNEQTRADALKALSALRSLAVPGAEPVAQPEPSVWLIERGQSCNQSPTIWWKGDDAKEYRGSYESDWTEDANEAIKFPTESAAERVASKFFARPSDGALSVIITEHIFVDMPRSATPPAQPQPEFPW